jgi:hypothetical protein
MRCEVRGANGERLKDMRCEVRGGRCQVQCAGGWDVEGEVREAAGNKNGQRQTKALQVRCET